LSYERRLLQLRILLGDSAVPSGDLEKLKTRTGIIKIIDELYEIQDMLLTPPSVPPNETSQPEDWISGRELGHGHESSRL
jgi:hypothetical protein